jgi:hypothetical protein
MSNVHFNDVEEGNEMAAPRIYQHYFRLLCHTPLPTITTMHGFHWANRL